MSYTYEITTAGKALIAKAQTGVVIDFTKVEIGRGGSGESPADFTGLLDPVSTNEKIQQKVYIQGTGNAKITITYTNEGLGEGFSVKEIGLFANDPDVGEILFLYCYSDEADYLPASSNTTVEQVVNLVIAVDNATDVTAQINMESPVIRSNFSANTILKADQGNEPEELVVEENRLVGRKTGGVIEDLSPNDVREIQNNATKDAVFKNAQFDDAIFNKVTTDELVCVAPSSSVTEDITILKTDVSREFILTRDAASEKTFRFDSLDSSVDGKIWHFRSESDHTLTIMPPTGSDISIWKSGKGHGIECPETGWISLRYDHGRKKLEPVQYGGQWWIEGLQLYMPCQTLGAYYAAPSYISNFIPDNIGVKKHASMHGGYITGGPNFKFNDRSLYLPLSHSSCVALYGNWDIFENKSVDFTIGGWVCFQGPAGGHTVTGVYQDSNNYWLLYRMTDTKMSFQKINNGIVEIQAISNITIPNAQWSFVVAVIKGGNIGLYVDGQQESWAESSSWNESPISGTLFFGKSGNNTLYADIKIKDMFLCKQNLFDAEPNEGLLDSIYLPKNILNLGMEK